MATPTSAEITLFEPDQIVFDLTVERPGLLFVSEIWHPSWQAYLDGDPIEVYRTNVAFRGVEVPAGRHELRFRYSAAEFRLGFGLSALGVLLALAVLAWDGWRAARKPTPDPAST